MADAYARSTASLGVCITSTGPAAGNIAGSMVEALTAGAPVLHITGQIETPYIDRGMSYIHEAPDQLTMLKAISKAAFRVRSVENVLGTLKRAVQVALTAPTGPVSVEIPIDIQSRAGRDAGRPVAAADRASAVPSKAGTRRAGRGPRQGQAPVAVGRRRCTRMPRAAIQRLQKLGFGVVTTHARPRHVPEDDAGSLGAYNIQKPVEALYQTCDAMLVVGSRLRGNETLKYELKLPRPLYRIDADAAAEGRCYAADAFVCGDAALALEGSGRSPRSCQVQGRSRALWSTCAPRTIRPSRRCATASAPTPNWCASFQSVAGRNFNWVRDVTVSNSTWGNRDLRILRPVPACTPRAAASARACPWRIGAAHRRGR